MTLHKQNVRDFPESGDLVYLNFNPQTGHEQADELSAIVISPYEFNIKTGFAVVCPTTNKVKGIHLKSSCPST